MKIREISKVEGLGENFVNITYRDGWYRLRTKLCMVDICSRKTVFAESGKSIPIRLWKVVYFFIRSGKKEIKL